MNYIKSSRDRENLNIETNFLLDELLRKDDINTEEYTEKNTQLTLSLLGWGQKFCYINHNGAPYFLRLCDFSGNLFRKMIK